MDHRTIGFVGLGRLGLPVASLLLDAGYPLVCCKRGRSDELVSRGATIPGDGAPKDVAEVADVVFTCLNMGSIGPVITGKDGILAAANLPVVIDLTTAPVTEKQGLRAQLNERGSDLLDCPVSGTPAMAAAKLATIFASGDRKTYDDIAELLTAVSPSSVYVGELGAGAKMKYIANLLAFIHVTAAAEAMALAANFDLDLDLVAQVISASPGATSGQFNIRAPMIAAGQFDGKLVTVKETREVLEQIASAAADAGASIPLLSVTKQLIDDFGDQGNDDSEPAKLTLSLRDRASRHLSAPAAGPS